MKKKTDESATLLCYLKRMVNRILATILILFWLATPTQVLAETIQERLETALDSIPGVGDERDFTDSFLLLRPPQQVEFLVRFEQLSLKDRELVISIHSGGLQDADDDRSRARLVRGAIMIADIRENVQYVVDNAEVRREDDGTTESIGIVRFLENVTSDYPSTIGGPLDTAFIEEAANLYDSAVQVLQQQLEEGRRQLEEGRQQLAGLRSEIAEMRELILKMEMLIIE